MAQGTNVAKYLIVFETSGAQQTQQIIKGIQSTLAPFNVKIKELDDSMKKAGTSTKTFGQNMVDLTKRAMMTIPVWLALRAAVMGVLGVFQDGVKYIVDFDKAMAKMKAVTTGVGDINKFMKEAGGEAKKIMIETGQGIDKIAEAYYRFAETGARGEVAIEGMKIAMKLSIATMNDSAEVSRMLIDLYNLLGDTIKGATTPQEKFAYTAELFTVLWEKNAGNLGEYINALKSFGGVAAAWNLGLKETLTLTISLHNFMQRAGTAGTQMARAFTEIAVNGKAMQAFLGKDIDTYANKWELFLAILEKLHNSIVNNIDISKDVVAMFGERALKGVLGLAKGYDKLKSSISEANAVAIGATTKLDEKYQLQIETLDTQIQRMGKLKGLVGEAFIKGITGTTEYLEGLKKINDFIQNSLIPNAEKLGGVIYAVFNPMGAVESHRTKAAGAWASKGESGQGFLDILKKERPDLYKQYKEQGKLPEDEFNAWQVGRARYNTNIKLPKITVGGGEAPITPTGVTPEISREADRTFLETKLKLVEKLKMLGYDAIAIERIKLELMIQELGTLISAEDLEKQRLKILDLEIKKQVEFSEGFKKSIEEGMASLLKRESTFKDFFKRIGEYYREAVFEQAAKGMTAKIFEKTGIGEIFGGNMIAIEKMFGGMGGQIKASHLEGILAGVPYIKQAHAEGMMQGASGSNGSRIPGMAQFSNWYAAQNAGGTTGMPLDTYTSGGSVLAQSLKNRDVKTGFLGMDWTSTGAIGEFQKAKTMKGKIGAGANMAMGAYELSQMYKLKGTGNVLGGVLGGAMAGSMFGPVGMVIGGVIGGIMGGRTKTTEEWNRQTFQVASRIDTTNRELSIVNRNLVALKSTIETFIMPESAYYGTKRNLEDNFSISTRRGGL